MTRANLRAKPRTALVIGANGYIGEAVARAFVRAGYRVFGLVRRPECADDLSREEVIPVVGSLDDLSFLPGLSDQSSTFDVIVNGVEGFGNFETLYAQLEALVVDVAARSNADGVRPLVLWSSGCKDYPLTGLHGDADLAPVTESSPIDSALPLARARAETALRVLKLTAVDAAILRPTSVYGYSSSYYGGMLEHAEREKAKGQSVLRIPGRPNSIMHAAHIDDCAEAYVALAEHPNRAEVAGQAFNISGYRYETTAEVGAALAREYGFTGGVEFVAQEVEGERGRALGFLFDFPQWVGSDSIRQLTGWTDKRGLFCEGLHVYRLAYEAARRRGHENISVTGSRLEAIGRA